MGEFIAFPGMIVGFALVATSAVSSRFIDNGSGGATTLTLAGGLFTIALAAYIKE